MCKLMKLMTIIPILLTTSLFSAVVYVKTPQGKSIRLEVKPSDLMSDIRHQIFIKTGIPSSRGRLIFEGRELQNDTSLASNNIQRESMLCLSLPYGRSYESAMKDEDRSRMFTLCCALLPRFRAKSIFSNFDSSLIVQIAEKIPLVHSPCSRQVDTVATDDYPVNIGNYDSNKDQEAIKNIVEAYPHELASWAYVQTHLKNDDQHYAKVLRKGAEVIGFCTYCLFKDNNWCIRFLGIRGKEQNKGYGRQLIAEAEQTIKNRGYNRIDISVVSSNLHAKSIYEKLGYKENGWAFSGVHLLSKNLTEKQTKQSPPHVEVTAEEHKQPKKNQEQLEKGFLNKIQSIVSRPIFKKIIIIAGTVVAASLVGYGLYRFNAFDRLKRSLLLLSRQTRKIICLAKLNKSALR